MNLSHTTKRQAFTIVELLIVITVIGIMSALVISSFSGAAQDTRRVIARQQQASIQNAVNAWVTSQSAVSGLATAQQTYNGQTTSMARFNLVRGYLDDSTADHITANSSPNGDLLTTALRKVGQQIQLPQWAASSYPKVELIDTP